MKPLCKASSRHLQVVGGSEIRVRVVDHRSDWPDLDSKRVWSGGKTCEANCSKPFVQLYLISLF